MKLNICLLKRESKMNVRFGPTAIQFRPTILRTFCNNGPTTAVGWMYIIFC